MQADFRHIGGIFGNKPPVAIAGNIFQENLEKIMNYIARKGGRILRDELMASRVIKGTAIDYVALIDAGFVSEIQSGRWKDTRYFSMMHSLD